MFTLHVGTTPCELTQADYRELGKRTEGWAWASCPIDFINELELGIRAQT